MNLMKRIALVTLLLTISLAIFSTCQEKDDNSDDMTILGLLALSSTSPAKTVVGSTSDLQSAGGVSSAASAASQATAAANAILDAYGSSATWSGQSVNTTVYCNGTALLYTTDQGKGSIVISGTITGSYTSANAFNVTMDVTNDVTVTFSACQLQGLDYSQLSTWTGSTTLPVVSLTITGAMAQKTTNKINLTGSSTGTAGTCSYSATISGTSSVAGTVTSSGLTIQSGSSTLLNNGAMNLTINNNGTSTFTSAYSGGGTYPSCGSTSLTGSGNGLYNAKGTVGGNAVDVNYNYTISY
ncbi:MAG: hypothetical protein KDK39_11865 [Leptospiraceae bacterium]|nr:hypothetical protein [Leptospiraceae bacterium]